MVRVLVTGGTGLLGGPATRRFVHLGHTVIAFDRAPQRENLGDVVGEVEIVQGDVADRDQVFDVMGRFRIERVLHLAAALPGTADPVAMVVSNCLGTGHVFEAARATGVARVCWASSAGVYGRREQYPGLDPVDEDALLGPTTVYGATKMMCEQLSTSYREELGLDTIGIRAVASYGIGRLSPRGTGAFNRMVRDVALGMPAVFPATLGTPESVWQPMYNEDAAAAFVAGTLVGHTDHGILNAPAVEIATVGATMEIIRELVPTAGLEFDTEARGEGSSDFPLLDGSRAIQELGVTPQYELRSALREMIEHFRSERD